ncbi:GNAT family N-acetyltransferase [Priestia taiwanensis]|uniref:N-acetyltransferase domain-containing protein n=1 Tax=Priestia taiwanensis TaxID=1347902 RepID=A0A917EQ48_9BACI|nr:GNAT family N-acetyltransferase [Priestia taiwanensis]MBM7362789.1 GNAT superfamily N-acetyltransferase [Priestia taiwanensis]GGE65097.1 hypothetical protein GCM10007140_14130 [Priestia taiwanensis]
MDNSLNNQCIVQAIESQHWDYEKELIPDSVEYIHSDRLIMIKNELVQSTYANKIIRFAFQQNRKEEVERVLIYFGDIPFAWWMTEEQLQEGVGELVTTYGFQLKDTYKGMAMLVADWQSNMREKSFVVYEVETEKEIEDLVEVSAAIWGYNKESLPYLFEQRKAYITSPYKKGTYYICYEGDKPIGYAQDRRSSDGKTLYLTGSGVLSTYRKKGAYRALLEARLQKAKETGIRLITTHARDGHSAPILEKMGFHTYITYIQLEQNKHS